MLRANPRVFSTALFSALGLLPLACGGAFSAKDDAEGGTSSGGTSSGGTSSGGSASGGKVATGGKASGGSTGSPCDDPKPAGAGYEQCGNGTVHRPSIEACPSMLPRPAAKIALPPGGQCMSDGDCADMPHGYCTTGVQLPGTVCAYGCVKDSECGAGNICVCGDPVGHCAGATCTSDAACGAGLRCQSFDSSHGCGIMRFACQTPKDTCDADADCMGQYCDATSGTFQCVQGGCAIGRPFLVAGAERVAPVVTRADWLQAFELEGLGDVPNEVRQAAALHYQRVAQMEHASVAAFARFALQLLQLGAPPELVERATRAMADETRHARLSFGIASALAGAELGPAGLDIEHSMASLGLADIVRLVVREGCIGETSAALEAREAAALATQPSLAAALNAVADDEAGHAELAWRFVSWALERAPEQIAPVLQSELTRETARLAALTPAPTSADELSLAAFGVVPEALRLELQNAALEQVIRPCAAALLAKTLGVVRENQVLSA